MPDDIDLLQMFRDELPGPSAGAWARARVAVSAARSGRRETGQVPPATVAAVSAAVVTAALIAGAVALVAVGVPGSRHTGTEGSAVDTAYVVKRVNSALSAATPGAIAQMTVTTRRAAISGGRTTRPPPRNGPTATSGARSRTRRPGIWSTTRAPAPATSVYTLVSYLARTWARQAGLGRPAGTGIRSARLRAGGRSPARCCFSPGCRAPDFSASPRPRLWPERCAPRSPAGPWPWPAGSASTGSRQSS